MGKTVLINQPCGIGDIFFLQKIVHLNIEKGNNVIYPINNNLLFLNDYIKFDNFQFVPIESNFEYKFLFNSTDYIEDDNVIYYPCCVADRYVSGCVMRAKYKRFGIDWEDWSDYFKYERNIDKENELFYNVLELTDDTKYNFVNKTYGTFPHSLVKHAVHPKKDLMNIEMRLIEGYTIFDWLKVIEKATNFYSVDTAILFLMENQKLVCENNDIELWTRHTHYGDIDGLFKKNYKYN
jgi:hypothetical protein